MQPPVFRAPADPLVWPSPAKHSHQLATGKLGDREQAESGSVIPSTSGRAVGGRH